MGKFIKYLLVTVVTLVILLAIGIGILIATVNPNDLKGPITQQVKNMTGRQITIAGNINWSFFPWLGINIHQVQVANPAGFGDKPFAQLKEADVRLKLLPLISGNFELGKLVLKGLTVNLIKKSNGADNWQDLTNLQKQTAKPQQAAAIIKTNSNKKSRYSLAPLALTISAVNISDANLNLQDLQKKHSYAIHNLSLQSRNINLAKSFPVILSFDFNSTNPNIFGKLNLNTKVQLNQAEQTITIAPFTFAAQLNGKGFPKNGLTVSLEAKASINLQQQTMDLADMHGQIANFQFHGDATGKNIFDDPSFNGSLTIPQFNPQLLANSLGQPLPQMEDANALSSASMQTQFVASESSLDLNNLKLKLDKSTLSGDVALNDPDKATSTFNLSVDQIDLANYMATGKAKKKSTPAAKAAKTPAATPAQAAAAASEEIPVTLLRKLNLQGHLQIGKLAVGQLQMSNVKLQITAKNGLIKIAPITAYLYQGQYKGQMSLNARGNVPKISVNENISNVQIAQLYNSFSKSTRFKVTGTANLAAKIQGRGMNTKDITKSLAGTVKFSMHNGVLKGINLGHQLDVATALVNKNPVPAQRGVDETPFGDLTGTFILTNGVATNNDLLMQSPAMRVTGGGVINLVNQTIDYQFKTSALQGRVDPQIFKVQQLLGGSIPVKITGTFAHYKVYPDTGAILKGVAKAYIQQQAGKVQQQMNKQLKGLGNQLKKSLGNIFN